MMNTAQQSRMDDLRQDYAAKADAAREFDHIADTVNAAGPLFSKEGHEVAVAHLRMMHETALAKANELRDQLKANEGWQTCR